MRARSSTPSSARPARTRTTSEATSTTASSAPSVSRAPSGCERAVNECVEKAMTSAGAAASRPRATTPSVRSRARDSTANTINAIASAITPPREYVSPIARKRKAMHARAPSRTGSERVRSIARPTATGTAISSTRASAFQ